MWCTATHSVAHNHTDATTRGDHPLISGSGCETIRQLGLLDGTLYLYSVKLGGVLYRGEPRGRTKQRNRRSCQLGRGGMELRHGGGHPHSLAFVSPGGGER